MKVRVYPNTTKSVWSVHRHIRGRGWRVAGHLKRLALKNVVPVSSQSKRDSAGLEGELVLEAFTLTPGHRCIKQRDRSSAEFRFEKDGSVFKTSHHVVLTDQAYAL